MTDGSVSPDASKGADESSEHDRDAASYEDVDRPRARADQPPTEPEQGATQPVLIPGSLEVLARDFHRASRQRPGVESLDEPKHPLPRRGRPTQ